jgi:competence protein ComGF
VAKHSLEKKPCLFAMIFIDGHALLATLASFMTFWHSDATSKLDTTKVFDNFN